MSLMEKIFGDLNEKALKKIYPIADQVMALEPEMEKLSDQELRNKTPEFKERLAAGETLDDLLPEAFAVCREGSLESPGNETLQSTGNWRNCSPSGQNIRDEDW